MCFSVQVVRDIDKLKIRFGATPNPKAFDYLNSHQVTHPKLYKIDTDSEQRIYTKSWAPLITQIEDKREIRPMRYQLLPHFCSEPKYLRKDPKTGKTREIQSTYNARTSSLSTAAAWRTPFMKHHGIININSFYEWVSSQGAKKQIEFFDPTGGSLSVACLYDNWYSHDRSLVIQSFAIITREPPREVLEKGHDRCPVILQEHQVNDWLNPQGSGTEKVWEILNGSLHLKLASQFI